MQINFEVEYGSEGNGAQSQKYEFPSLEGSIVKTTFGSHVKLGMRIGTIPSPEREHDTEIYYCNVLTKSILGSGPAFWNVWPELVIHSDYLYDNIVYADYILLKPEDYEDPANPRTDAERAAQGLGSPENPQPNDTRSATPYSYMFKMTVSGGPFYQTENKPIIPALNGDWSDPALPHVNFKRIKKLDAMRDHYIPNYEDIMCARRIARIEAFYREYPDLKAAIDADIERRAEEFAKEYEARKAQEAKNLPPQEAKNLPLQNLQKLQPQNTTSSESAPSTS